MFIVIALLVLSVLVLVHEFGHFYVAKKSGVYVEEFGIGLPPRVWGKKIGETIYSVNALPIGGFVRLHGETTDEKVTDKTRAFLYKPKKVRVAVAMAGIFMNFLLAIFFYSVVNFVTGVPRELGEVKVVEVTQNTPAAEVGLLEGDIVKSVDGNSYKTSNDFVTYVAEKQGQEIKIDVNRNGEGMEFIATPRIDHPTDEGALGVIVSSQELYQPPILQRPFIAIWHGIKDTWYISKLIVAGFASIFTTLSSGQVPKGVAGPVGITALIAGVAKLGVLPLLELSAIISVNLALLNMVPFPPLDGSRVMFVGLEAIFGKRKLPKIEEYSYMVGMAILLVLMVLLSANEIPKLLKAGSFDAFINSILK